MMSAQSSVLARRPARIEASSGIVRNSMPSMRGWPGIQKSLFAASVKVLSGSHLTNLNAPVPTTSLAGSAPPPTSFLEMMAEFGLVIAARIAALALLSLNTTVLASGVSMA